VFFGKKARAGGGLMRIDFSVSFSIKAKRERNEYAPFEPRVLFT